MRSVDKEASFFLTRIKSSRTNQEWSKNFREFSEWLQWLRNKHHITANEESLFLQKAEESKINLPQGVRTFKFKYLAILLGLILASILLYVVFHLYRNFSSLNKPRSTQSSPKILPFSGSLIDSKGTPIDYAVDVTFNLYADQLSADSLYKGVCAGEYAIMPDYQGSFTISLGKDCDMTPISENLFVDFPVMYLGVTIAGGEELTPRYLINTYTYLNPQIEQGSPDMNLLFDIDVQNNEFKLKGDDPKIRSLDSTLSLEGESLLLQSTGVDNGDIWIQPSVNNATVFPIGHVGIGIFKPEQKLVVAGAEPFSSLVSFLNTADTSTDQPHLLDLKLGVPGTSSQGTFVRFYAESTMESSGTQVGSIKLNKGGVVYETKGADFAEYFETDQVWPAGTVMSVSQRGISNARVNEPVVGVVSLGAGFVGNSTEGQTDKNVLIGLVGQVDVFVSTEKGKIKVGDLLEVGTIPGFGVKGGMSQSSIGYVFTNPQDVQFSNALCPHAFRGLFDPSGKQILCGTVPVLLQGK